MLRWARLLVVGLLTVGLMACGVSSGVRRASREAAAPDGLGALTGTCGDVARSELADVARRIYAQAVDGGGVVSAVERLQRSPALANAVASGDRVAARAAFAPLRHQIVRIELTGRGKTIYRFGHRRRSRRSVAACATRADAWSGASCSRSPTAGPTPGSCGA